MKDRSLSSNAAAPWSARIAQRYDLTLSEELADWFDAQLWKEPEGGTEFCQVVPAEQLLEERPDFLWPGFLPPDLLPILGNQRGDWLCLRFGADDRVGEVIHWYHGGGDWIPWGKGIAEAIAFDIARWQLPGRRQEYAIAAESQEPLSQPTGALARWARRWLPTAVQPCLTESAGEPVDSCRWLSAGVAEVAIRCELTLEALDSPLRSRLTPRIAGSLGISWEPDAVRWMFDTRLLPERLRGPVADSLDLPADRLDEQRWDEAAGHARALTEQRDDLGWAFDVAGWQAEREGRWEEACRHYGASLRASWFTDQTIRFRTHWTADRYGKFAAARLEQLRDRVADADWKTDPYLNILWQPDPTGMRERVRSHWAMAAHAAGAQGRWGWAYEHYYRAGWDFGLDDLGGYAEVLAALADAAHRAGQRARARLAETHLACLLERIGP